jgi:hypothetical protein
LKESKMNEEDREPTPTAVVEFRRDGVGYLVEVDVLDSGEFDNPRRCGESQTEVWPDGWPDAWPEELWHALEMAHELGGFVAEIPIIASDGSGWIAQLVRK